MENEVYKIYVKIDGNKSIIAANTSAFIKDTTGWTEAGEQTNRHLGKAVYNEYGVPQFKLSAGKIVKRTNAEIDADNTAAIAERDKLAKRSQVKKLQSECLTAIFNKIKSGTAIPTAIKDKITQINNLETDING
jgi:hypothetical protein